MTNTIFKNNTKIGNPYDFLDRNRHRKMVFYGRVSTEHEAQMAALENQIDGTMTKRNITPTGRC